jgi:hypothetical protein
MPQKKAKSSPKPRAAKGPLSPLVVAGKSAIHGTGLFAARAIRKGTFLGTYEGPRTKKDGTHVLWLHAEDGGYGINGKNELRFVNHSAKPNACFDGDELFAVRAIQAGQEITHHYGPEWDEEPTARGRSAKNAKAATGAKNGRDARVAKAPKNGQAKNKGTARNGGVTPTKTARTAQAAKNGQSARNGKAAQAPARKTRTGRSARS